MSNPKRRRLVGTFDSTETRKTFHSDSPEPPNRLASDVQDSHDREGGGSGVPARPVQPHETNPGGQGDEPDECEAPPTLGKLDPLTNEQIEERLRKLAGPSLDLLERLTAAGVAGRKLPRSVQAAIGNAQWVITQARAASKAQQSAESDRERAAKLERARKSLGGAQLTAALQAQTRAERTGQGDGTH